MIKVGINGLGRIGKAIFRVNDQRESFEIVAINDINPDIQNLAYQLNYDSLYPHLCEKITAENGYLTNSKHNIKVFNEQRIDKVDWKSIEADIVIDSSGVFENVLFASKALNAHSLDRIIITHCPKEVDFTLVLGSSHQNFNKKKHKIISSSICDATAIAPVLNEIHKRWSIENGYITTLHPWLNYQNLMDGAATSWTKPGEIYHHYALGRSMNGNIIPKPTTAIEATCAVVEGLDKKTLGSFSYRTPHPIVGSADITLTLKNNTSTKEVIELFEKLAENQAFKIFKNNFEPLVSHDFKCCNFSAVVDHRWTDVINGNLLKIILWYDNEWGYSNRVVDQVLFITEDHK